MQLDPTVMEMIARKATAPRFILVCDDGTIIETETQDDFHDAATTMHKLNRRVLGGFYGVPLHPVLNGNALFKKPLDFGAACLAVMVMTSLRWFIEQEIPVTLGLVSVA